MLLLIIWLANCFFLPKTVVHGEEKTSRWEDKPLIDILEMKVSGDHPLQTEIDRILVEELTVKALEREVGVDEGLKELRNTLKDAEALLSKNDLRLISLNYLKASLLLRAGKAKASRALLRTNFKRELKRDFLIEKSWRKHLTFKEIKNESMETEEEFESRFDKKKKEISFDFVTAALSRLLGIYFDGRVEDAIRLSNCLASNEIIDLDGGNSDTTDSLKLWIMFIDRKKEFIEFQTGKRATLAKAIRLLSSGETGPALDLLKTIKKQDPETSNVLPLVNLLKVEANLKLKDRSAAENILKDLIKSSKRKRRGFADSFINRPFTFYCLSKLTDLLDREFVSILDNLPTDKETRYDTGNAIEESVDFAYKLKEKKAPCKVDEETENKLKSLSTDFYFAGYEYKTLAMQKLAQKYLTRSVLIIKLFIPSQTQMLDGYLYDLGESYFWNKKYEVGAAYLEECLKLRRKRDVPLDTIVMTMSTLGRCLISARESERAEEILTEALACTLKGVLDRKYKVKNFISSIDGRDETASGAGRSFVNSIECGTKDGEFSTSKFLSLAFKQQLAATKTVYEIADSQGKDAILTSMQNWIDGYLSTRHYDEAYSACCDLLQLKKDAFLSYANDVSDNIWQLAYIAGISKRPKESSELYSKLFKSYPSKGIRSKALWHYSRGLSHDALAEYRDAKDDFKEAARLLSILVKDIEDVDDWEFIYWLKEDLKNEVTVRKKDPPDRDTYFKSYELFRWPLERMPLKVFIDTSRDRGFAGSLLKVIKDGINQWIRIKNPVIKFKYVSDREEADIYVERVDNYDYVAKGSAGRAQAELLFEGKNQLNKVHLRIFSVDRTGEKLSNHAIRQMKTLACHEFGHALGLQHSPNGLDIMYWKADALEISDRDIKTLLKLYGCKE